MPLADTLLRLAEPPALYEPRWTNHILAEVTRTLVVRFGKTPEKANYREDAMREFFPASMVQGYDHLIATMTNHPKDRHVLAAAVSCRAEYVVTFNLKDFVMPLAQNNVAVIGPSTFLKQLATHDREAVETRLHEQASAIGISLTDLLGRLAVSVPGFISMIRT